MTVLLNKLMPLAAIASAFLLFSAGSTRLNGLEPAISKTSPAVTAPTPASKAATGQLHTLAAPTVRVTAKVDNTKRAMLYGHVPAALKHATDLGRVSPKTPAQHIVMVLNSSDDQKHALRQALDEQQDKSSANYHAWVTPEQFGEHFGVHEADIAKVSAWLASQGFTVEDVSKSKRVLHFSGTTGQIESAFQTEMHQYRVGAETHVSISRDISVPNALQPVISGVTLHNFFRKGHMGPVRKLSDDRSAELAKPMYTASTTTHYIGPWDFATIYNTFPLLNSGIDGTGTSIAIVGRSDILMSDVQTYRTMFDLPDNDPVFVHAGQDNGTEPGDDGESDLDVEISGGIAPKSQVYFVIGTPTYLVDGITNSIEYIVENNTADIMSISYGSCESIEGVGGNEFNNQAFEQAAAQGISVFVAAGDNGPAECDDSNDSYENLGYSTGGEASTPYSVSVGGTQMFEGTTAAQEAPYWSTTTGQAPYWGLSALSYMPEVPWNEAKGADKSDSPAADLSGIWSGSGGISSYYLQPSWQRGSGILTTDPALPGGDWVTGVTLSNAGGSGYIAAPTVTFTGGGCVTEPVATTVISGGSVTGITFNYGTQGGTLKAGQGFGCTSAPTVAFGAAPAGGVTATATANIGPMWNVLPLISGVPHRLTPDLALNAASGHDATIFCSEGVCETSTSGGTVTLNDAGLVGGTSVAAPSMAGIQALINQANGGRQGMPGYIYYALANADSLANCNSSLPPAAGSNCAFQDVTVGDNYICGASTCTTTTQKMGFAAGTGYDLASGLGSVNAANLSGQWKSVVFNSSTTNLNVSQTTSIPQGTPITFTGTVAGAGSGNTPTGDVAFILSQGGFGETIDISGDPTTGAYNGPGAFATLNGGSYTATLSNLPGGSYTITARYAGDANFASSLSAPVPVTVATGNSTVTLTPQNLNDTTSCSLVSTNTYTYGQLVWIPATVASSTGAGVPTGTVTLTVDGAVWGTVALDPNGTGYLAAGSIYTSSCLYGYIFSQGPLLTAGVHTIGASYSGDATFSPATAATVQVTVSQLASTPTLAAGALNITSGFTEQLTATFPAVSALTSVSPTTGSAPTGLVTFTDTTTGTVLGTAATVPVVTYSGAQSYTFSATAVLSTAGITAAGANSIVASYSGDINYVPTTSTAVTVTVDAAAPVATTTTVSSSANPTTLAGRPTFTATIAAASGTAPTSGTVTFYDGTAVLGTGTVGTAHTATLKLAASPAFIGGTHSITAVYGGIAANGPSTSAVFVETVTKGTGTIILSGKTPSKVGTSISFAAVLTPSSTSTAYSPVLANVQFFDGSTNIGSALAQTITATQGGYGLWTATLSTASLAAGTHTITAQYSDANYTFTASNTQTVKVYGTPLGNLDQAIDSTTNSTSISTADTLFVSGWTADPTDGSPLNSVKIYIDGVAIGTPTLGIARPDVASAFNNQAYAASGFTFTYPAGSLSVGTHTVSAIATNLDNISKTLGSITISVTPVYVKPVGNLDQAIDAGGAGSSVSQSTGTLFVSGWAADYQDNGAAKQVQILIDGTVAGLATLGQARPDVAAAFNNPAWANTGYTFTTSVSGLSPGNHTVTAIATDSLNLSTGLGPITFTVVP